MQDRALSHDAIEVHFNTTIDDALGDSKGQLSGLKVKNGETGELLQPRAVELVAIHALMRP